MLNQSVGMHNLKSASAQLYAYNLLRHGAPYNQSECSEQTNPSHRNWKGITVRTKALISLRRSAPRPQAS